MAQSKKQSAASKATLPKGFEAIQRGSESWPNDDTVIGEMIQGKILEFDSVTVKRGKKTEEVEMCRVETKDKKTYTLWRSAGLAPLFDYEEGTEFAIIYDGYGKAKKGQNAPRLYRIGVK